jgi:hypothetical protein
MVFGSWDSGFCPWASGDQHCLATKCVCNSLQDRFTGFGSCLWASGKQTLLCIEMHTRLGLKFVCSWFLVWIKSAWQGCHVAHKSPAGILGTTQCSVIQLPMQLVYALGSVLVWIKSAQQGRHVAYKLPQGIRYESMQSINLVGTRC